MRATFQRRITSPSLQSPNHVMRTCGQMKRRYRRETRRMSRIARAIRNGPARFRRQSSAQNNHRLGLAHLLARRRTKLAQWPHWRNGPIGAGSLICCASSISREFSTYSHIRGLARVGSSCRGCPSRKSFTNQGGFYIDDPVMKRHAFFPPNEVHGLCVTAKLHNARAEGRNHNEPGHKKSHSETIVARESERFRSERVRATVG